MKRGVINKEQAYGRTLGMFVAVKLMHQVREQLKKSYFRDGRTRMHTWPRGYLHVEMLKEHWKTRMLKQVIHIKMDIKDEVGVLQGCSRRTSRMLKDGE